MKSTSSRILKCGNLFSMVVALVFAASAEGGKSVFSDAAIWLKGVHDATSNGSVNGTDLRHALDMSQAVAGAAAYGGSESRLCTKMNVPCPYSGSIISNVPCIHLAQTVIDDKCDWASFCLSDENGAVSVTNCIGSVVMRIRPDEFINAAGYYWVFGGVGFSVGFCKNDNYPGMLRLRGYCGIWQTMDYYVSPGTWMDLAVVACDNKLNFYAVTNNGSFWSQSKAATFSEGIQKNLYLGLNSQGSNGSGATNSTSGTRRLAFRGAIQSFSVWNRALSESEVREAFSFPRADIVRMGIADGAGGEFVKTSSDGAPVNADDWYGMPASLAPGEEVDVSFVLKEHEYALPQILRLTSTFETSTGAMLAVRANDVGEWKNIMAVPGRTKSILLPGSVFQSGSNTLNIVNNSSGTVYFDELALGGSWQVGYSDSNHEEFSSTRSNTRGWVDDSSWNFYRAVVVSTTNAMIMNVPLELSGYPAKLTVGAGTAFGVDTIDPPPVCEILVNGVGKGKMQFTEQWQTFTVRLKQGELKAGTNEFSFVCCPPSDPKRGYFFMDYWRMEMKCPKGLMISVR